ncbi:MAG: hypothetical protein ABEH65_10020 [Halobacteriales archaeon]
MDISRQSFLIIAVYTLTGGCLAKIQTTDEDVNPDAIFEYEKGKHAFDKAEEIWETAITNYNMDNWAQASQQFQFTQDKYTQSRKYFEKVTNMNIPDDAIEYANQSSKHVEAMSEAAKYFSNSASGYALVDVEQIDENYELGQKYLEMAQKIPAPVEVTTFRSTLQQ